MFSKIGILGVGLIGGSVGLAVKSLYPDCIVVGIGQRPERLAVARQLGAVDEYTTSIQAGVAGCELVIVGTPVNLVVERVLQVIGASDGAILVTDVGSTKQAICAALDKEMPFANGCSFLGGHPIAGSEKSGVEAATVSLFEQRLVVLTPTSKTPPNATATLQRFWESLGARVACMKPEEHDAVFARTSHLPHAISATLAAMTDYERLRTFLGTGFESVARLAGGDPNIWRDIFMTNRDALCKAITDYEGMLKQLHDALSDNDADAVFRFLEQARNASR